MALSGHPTVARQCPLLDVKRTSRRLGEMSAYDPKRTWRTRNELTSAGFWCDSLSRQDARSGASEAAMERREFVSVLCGVIMCPLTAWAQKSQSVRRIGVLLPYEDERDPRAAAIWLPLKQRLRELGWTENGNIRFELRLTGEDAENIRAGTKELVRAAPEVIIAFVLLRRDFWLPPRSRSVSQEHNAPARHRQHYRTHACGPQNHSHSRCPGRSRLQDAGCGAAGGPPHFARRPAAPRGHSDRRVRTRA
jgi:hypothetical protein